MVGDGDARMKMRDGSWMPMPIGITTISTIHRRQWEGEILT